MKLLLAHIVFFKYRVFHTFLGFLIRIILKAPFLQQKFFLKLKKHLEFELRNDSDPASISFYREGIKADIAFEFSSEGEFEQVLPIINRMLLSGQKVELVYCSPSVEAKAKKLFARYPHLVRALRLPLLSYYGKGHQGENLWGWLTAPLLVLCRYDFFPELFFYGKLQARKFYLIWGALKNKQEKMNSSVWYHLFYRFIFQLFDLIVAANIKEKKLFEQLLNNQKVTLYQYDFRVKQIAERLTLKDALFEKTAFLKEIAEHLQSKKNIKMVLGNFWADEIPFIFTPDILKAIKERKLELWIVPHLIDLQTQAELLQKLSLLDQNLNLGKISEGVFKADTSLEITNPHLFVLFHKGVLCEFYSLFDIAYVGGGFKRSVHSLLEPFLAGAKIICGPHIERSTEFDLVESFSPQKIKVLNRGEELTWQMVEDLANYRERSESSLELSQYLEDFNSHLRLFK